MLNTQEIAVTLYIEGTSGRGEHEEALGDLLREIFGIWVPLFAF